MRNPAGADSHRRDRRRFCVVAYRRSPLRKRLVQGRRSERAHPGVRLQKCRGINTGELPDPPQIAPRAPDAPGSDSGINDGVDRGSERGILALWRILARLQGLLRRTAVGHPSTKAGRVADVSRVRRAAHLIDNRGYDLRPNFDAPKPSMCMVSDGIRVDNQR